MPAYRRKSIEIEAVQFDGSLESGAAIVDWVSRHGAEEAEYHPFLADHFKGDPKVYVAHPDPYLRIKTDGRVFVAGPGDWVIRGAKGEFSPCCPEVFDDAYERVEELP